MGVRRAVISPALLSTALLLFMACGRVIVPAGDAGGTTAAGAGGGPGGGGAGGGVATGAGGGTLVDAGAADASGGCDCPPGLVYRRHECVPTKELGCGDPCAIGMTDCGDLHTCDPCAASSSCSDDDCQPTCVFTGPQQGPIDEGVLRISPTGGPADQEAEIRIEGYPFYVGALMYVARVGEIEVWQMTQGSNCSFTITPPPLASGLWPVRVSQYGPMDPWVLAGFYAAGSPEGPGCIQPGFPCGASSECCSLPEAPTSCVAGRCAAQ